MKRLILAFSLLFAAPLSAQQVEDSWVGRDKVLHAVAGYVVTDMVRAVGVSDVPAFVITTTAAVSWELLASGHRSERDVLATMTGAATNILFHRLVKAL